MHGLGPQALPRPRGQSRPVTDVPFHQYQDPSLMPPVAGPDVSPPQESWA